MRKGPCENKPSEQESEGQTIKKPIFTSSNISAARSQLRSIVNLAKGKEIKEKRKGFIFINRWKETKAYSYTKRGSRSKKQYTDILRMIDEPTSPLGMIASF